MRFSTLFLALLLCGSFAFATKTNIAPTSLQQSAEGKWAFEKVIEVPGTDKAVLYDRMKAWILANIKSGDRNDQTTDPSHETLITNVTLSTGKLWTLYSESQINFKLILEFKDNKMRVRATSFTYYALGTSASLGIINSPMETYRDSKVLINRVNERIDEAFPAFITSIENGAKSSVSKDW